MTTHKFNARFAFVTRLRFGAYIEIANEKFRKRCRRGKEGEKTYLTALIYIYILKRVTLVNNSVKYIPLRVKWPVR